MDSTVCGAILLLARVSIILLISLVQYQYEPIYVMPLYYHFSSSMHSLASIIWIYIIYDSYIIL
jgi:hypothetical protein